MLIKVFHSYVLALMRREMEASAKIFELMQFANLRAFVKST